MALLQVLRVPWRLVSLVIHLLQRLQITVRIPDRRSQFMMANFIEEPQSDSPSSPESDPEACIIPVDLTEAFDDGVSTPSSTRSLRSEDGFVDELQWDDIVSPVQNLNSYQWNDPVIAPARPPALPITPARPPALPIAPAFPPALPIPQERTPLIRKTNSFHVPTTRKGYDSIEGKKNTKTRTKPPRKIRPLEPTQKIQEVAVVKHYPVGRSTFGQTVSSPHVPDHILSGLLTFSN